MRLWVALLAACVHAGTTISSAPGMGKVHRAVHTTSPEAQRHSDAGLAKATGNKAIQAELDKAWARADVKLTGSVY